MLRVCVVRPATRLAADFRPVVQVYVQHSGRKHKELLTFIKAPAIAPIFEVGDGRPQRKVRIGDEEMVGLVLSREAEVVDEGVEAPKRYPDEQVVHWSGAARDDEMWLCAELALPAVTRWQTPGGFVDVGEYDLFVSLQGVDHAKHCEVVPASR